MKQMQISQDGLNRIKQYEGLRLNAYQDSGGVWTIGYGTTRINDKPVVKGNLITEAQANVYLNDYIDQLESSINHFLTVSLTQNQIDSVLALAYNIGIGAFTKSTLLKNININPNDFNKLRPLWLEWDMVNGQKSIGLRNRRMGEWMNYMK